MGKTPEYILEKIQEAKEQGLKDWIYTMTGEKRVKD